jgi:hypothetical protein
LLDLPFQGTEPSFYDARLWLHDARLDAVFADCVETSTRQIASVLFLEPSADGWRFGIGAIRGTAARPDLGDFFAGTGRAELAGRDSDSDNDSDADFTSKWLRVIAGREGGDGVPSPVYISPRLSDAWRTKRAPRSSAGCACSPHFSDCNRKFVIWKRSRRSPLNPKRR